MLINRQSAGKIKPLAYLTGVYLGDGCIVREPKKYAVTFRLNTIDMDFAEEVRKSLFEITNRTAGIWTYPVKKSTKPNHDLRLGCKTLCDFIELESHKKSIIPSYVSEYSKELLMEFISGIMDSEGYVSLDKRNNHIAEIGFKNTSDWSIKFNSILQSLGFKTRFEKCKPYKEWYKSPYRIRINTKSALENNLYFKIKRKQEKLDILRDYTIGMNKSS